MSNTYKTKPNWVKINNPKSAKEVKEYHDHRHHICDIDEAVGAYPFYWQRRGYCGYDVSYYSYHGGFYARPPHGKEIRNSMEGIHRAKWRATKHKLMKMSRDELEDSDVQNFPHRHSALWEMY